MTDEQIEQLGKWLHHHFDTEHLSWAEESEPGRDYYRKMARAQLSEVPFLAEWADRMSPPTTEAVSTGDADLDRQIDTAAFEAGLQHLYDEAKAVIARSIGLARDIGYRQAEAEHPDEQLDPGAVRAVELTDEQGQRGTLIGPADKIDSLVRPEAVVREDG